MKERIVSLVEKGENGARINRHFDIFIVWLILLDVLAIILETDRAIHDKYAVFFYWFEVFCVSVFAMEYLMRIYVSDITHPSKSRLRSIWKFMYSSYGVIDLIAILPFFLPFFIAIDLRILRMLRFLRFARLIKINRYNNGLNILWNVFKLKRIELAIVGMATSILLVIAATLMHFAEGEVQPDHFESITSSLYWAVSTVTSLGYGDVYPITPVGKLIASLVSISGIALFAIPTAIISSAFFELRSNKAFDCPHCGGEITSKHQHAK